jgi:hypothetical protein
MVDRHGRDKAGGSTRDAARDIRGQFRPGLQFAPADIAAGAKFVGENRSNPLACDVGRPKAGYDFATRSSI